jgi:diadenosine tetraphosphate (Ap4A) HIT family hydrolase
MKSKPIHKFIIPELARNDKQKEQYEQINKLGICPFCSKEKFQNFHKGKIIFLNKSWILSTNDNPYKGTKCHLILIFQGRHICHLKELTNEEWVLLKEILDFASEKFNIESGALLMRFGKPGDNGSSVEHLHAHIISGEGKMSETAQRIKVKVGYEAE